MTARHEAKSGVKPSKAQNRPLPGYVPILAIIIIWAAAEVLVDPRGNFPLNDDWIFGGSVWTLVTHHKFSLFYLASMSLASQILWGALFSMLFGFSFNVLRMSTLVLGLTGILATYGLLKEMRASAWMAFMGAMVVAFNPLYMELSNTFMTDVPFFGFAMLSTYLYVRALRRKSRADVIGATLAASLWMPIPYTGPTKPPRPAGR